MGGLTQDEEAGRDPMSGVLAGQMMHGSPAPDGDGARARGRTSFARIDGIWVLPAALGRFSVVVIKC